MAKIHIYDHPNQRTLTEAAKVGYTLFAKHQLNPKWKLAFNNTKRQSAFCSYIEKKILVSKQYAQKVDLSHLEKTFIHEISHALIGPGHGHGKKWQDMVRKLGHEPSRYQYFVFAKPKYFLRCQECGFAHEMYQHSSKKKWCPTCERKQLTVSHNVQ